MLEKSSDDLGKRTCLLPPGKKRSGVFGIIVSLDHKADRNQRDLGCMLLLSGGLAQQREFDGMGGSIEARMDPAYSNFWTHSN